MRYLCKNKNIRIMKHLISLLLLCCIPVITQAQSSDASTWDDPRWGDLGDGTFANPLILADYSDPDVIRVGNKYYMTCSEFHFMGMPILESDDMVNWKIIGQIFDHIELEKFEKMDGYGDGTWAPALRYHDGKFWMFVCMPNTGVYMSTADKPEGPWSPLYCMHEAQGWEDPCPLWDEDGKAYLGHSVLGGWPIIVHRMSPDGRRLLDDGVEIYRGPTAEGTKFFKKDGYYYLSIPEGGVSTGWQTVLRSKSIYGKYEGKRCLEMGTTPVNGPHQGALVDTPDGEWWFYHFQSHSPQGRILHLQPVTWQDGFPLIGKDYDGNGVGEPVKICQKPHTGVNVAPYAPQTSDNFRSTKLAPQWAWNHNPVNSHWSLTEKRGWLTLTALKADNLRQARNTLTQKSMGNTGEATVCIDFHGMAPGQRAGLAAMGNARYGAGVIIDADGTPRLYCEHEGDTQLAGPIPAGTKCVYAHLSIDDLKNEHRLSVSTDGEHFTPVGETFQEGDSDWKGYRIALYSYTTQDQGGKARFTDFQYHHDGAK